MTSSIFLHSYFTFFGLKPNIFFGLLQNVSHEKRVQIQTYLSIVNMVKKVSSRNIIDISLKLTAADPSKYNVSSMFLLTNEVMDSFHL